MKPAPSILRQYDLAAMRGWQTIRLDRRKTPVLQQSKTFAPASVVLKKAA